MDIGMERRLFKIKIQIKLRRGLEIELPGFAGRGGGRKWPIIPTVRKKC